jgi:2-polyprenyl-3-methyl-5-hydroxy-6-metoxy-1,4-benzoquinol methylase
MTDDLYNKWKETQLNWDDTEFLEKQATALMKIKWKKINNKVVEILEKEVVRKNEYLDFLDFGAGRGDFYKEIQGLVKKYTGIEPSEKMLKDEIIQEDFKLIRGCAEDFLERELYDVCLLKEVLDHCYSPEIVIKNSYNALKKDGILIVTLTNKNAFYKLIFKNWAKKIQEQHKDHLYNFSPDEVSELMKKNGFVIENILSFNYLKLPVLMERFLGILPSGIINSMLDMIDNIFKVFLKDKGGSFIIIGRKEPIREAL